MSWLAVLTPLIGVLAPLTEGDLQPEDVKPGWTAFIVFILLFVATFLLWGSMRKRLRNIHFDDGEAEEQADGEATATTEAEPASESVDPESRD